VIASLPMYDWPSLTAAHDRFWALLRDRLRAGGIAAPDALDRETPEMEAWSSPDLLLSQACGLPLRTFLKGRVTLVGCFDHDLPDTAPGHYRSHLIARRTDPRPPGELARRFARNSGHSQSGWAAAWNYLVPQGIIPTVTSETGAHRASAELVAEGRADLAAIDSVTWRILVAELPGTAARLRLVATTPETPALPLITALGRDPAPLRAALALALADLSPADRHALGLRALVDLPLSAWLSVPVPPLPEPAAVPG
jgi:ABC-type phosphate/phosphonate transport system substrate-binding protein